MKSRLVIRSEAVSELRTAYLWYESQRIGLVRIFVIAVRNAIAQIRENPRRYPLVFQSIRKASVNRFPCGVYFEYGEDCVIVLAVYHFKRSPDGWKSRS